MKNFMIVGKEQEKAERNLLLLVIYTAVIISLFIPQYSEQALAHKGRRNTQSKTHKSAFLLLLSWIFLVPCRIF